MLLIAIGAALLAVSCAFANPGDSYNTLATRHGGPGTQYKHFTIWNDRGDQIWATFNSAGICIGMVDIMKHQPDVGGERSANFLRIELRLEPGRLSNQILFRQDGCMVPCYE